jgi:hypothetical protein
MARGLSTAELNTIRETLAAGRRPKVVFTESAGQIAGQIGQVTGLTDPGLSDDWVVVRFGRDELPFSPTDLAVAPRGAGAAAARGRSGKRAEPAAPPGPELLVTPEIPAPRAEEPPAAPTPPAAEAQPPAAEPVAARPARKAARTPKAKPAPGLVVTLAYADGEWTVGAQQGSRALAKPYVIRAAEALKMVALLDVPGVQEAVEQIVAAERAEAEAEAERLRAQLAELEARLADLREAH